MNIQVDPFVIKWLLSLIVGTIWVAISATIAERVSGRIGGLIIGLPSTVVIGLLFIGITQDLDSTITASTVILFGTGTYCFYFLAYLLSSPKGFLHGVFVSLLIWLCSAIFAALATPKSFVVAVLWWFILVTLSLWFVNKKIRINHKLISKSISGSPIILKALVTGTVISLIVLVSKIAGPRWGGALATFPALTLSTILVTAKSGGIEFTRLIIKNVLISTTTTIGIFAILSYFLLPVFGVVVGITISYLLLAIICVPLYFFVFEKLKD